MISNENLNDYPIQGNFRLRGHKGTHMDGLTDGVFALAIAILLISSSVPTNYQELLAFVYDIFPFSICIIFIYWIWRALKNFNLRYGLNDSRTSLLKMALLFFLLFYVYPLKFLMSWQFKYFAAISSGKVRERYAEINNMIPFQKLSELMIIYGVGFFAIFFIIYLLYKRAYQAKVSLQLNEIEILETEFSMRQYLGVAGVGAISVVIALMSIIFNFTLGAMFAGLAYNLIWIFMIYESKYEKKKLAELKVV